MAGLPRASMTWGRPMAFDQGQQQAALTIDPRRMAMASEIAGLAHAGQFRKGTAIPYLSHCFAVASLVMEYGGNEEQILAALLHDVLEDGGAAYADTIRDALGHGVLSIVEACSDSTAEEKTSVSPHDRRADWKARKDAYLARLVTESPEALLVSGCDKLHNASSILKDLDRVGISVFDRFIGGLNGTLWYYTSVSSLMERRGCPVAPALSAVVTRIVTRCAESPV